MRAADKVMKKLTVKLTAICVAQLLFCFIAEKVLGLPKSY